MLNGSQLNRAPRSFDPLLHCHHAADAGPLQHRMPPSFWAHHWLQRTGGYSAMMDRSKICCRCHRANPADVRACLQLFGRLSMMGLGGITCRTRNCPSPKRFGSFVRTVRTVGSSRLVAKPSKPGSTILISVRSRRRGELLRAEELSVRAGSYEVRSPMAVWQIDHTVMDVMVVSSIDGVVIGKPYLTLIIDVASRMIAGFYISLNPPSSPVSLWRCFKPSRPRTTY
jgi:hypothetical protein